MRIYDFEGFPNPARVRIALAEKGATAKVEFEGSPLNAKSAQGLRPYFAMLISMRIASQSHATSY